jgi:hypothetical protein
MVKADVPPAAPLPAQEYTSLEAIDRTAFDDAVTAEAAALKVFNTWMRQLPQTPRDCSDLVNSLQLRARQIGRLVSEVVQRTTVWRQTPYDGPEPVGSPRLSTFFPTVDGLPTARWLGLWRTSGIPTS